MQDMMNYINAMISFVIFCAVTAGVDAAAHQPKPCCRPSRYSAIVHVTGGKNNPDGPQAVDVFIFMYFKIS